MAKTQKKLKCNWESYIITYITRFWSWKGLFLRWGKWLFTIEWTAFCWKKRSVARNKTQHTWQTTESDTFYSDRSTNDTQCIGAKTEHSINIWRNHSRLTSFVLWLAWNMQTTIPIAFWPPLVFTLCPSSTRFQLRCLSHYFWCSFISDAYHMFCRLCCNFRGLEGLENARMSFLFIKFCFPMT